MTSPILEFQNVSFSRGSRLLLDRMSFGIEKQDMVALIGPNGVGKTTMLKLASRLLQPSAGTVLMQGRPLAAWSRRELPRAVALVPQELEIPFNFRVEEIVAQGRVPYLPLFATSTALSPEAGTMPAAGEVAPSPGGCLPPGKVTTGTALPGAPI